MNTIITTIKKSPSLKSIFAASVILVSSCFCSAAFATDLKIAVVDFRQIMSTSPEAKVIEAKLKKEFGSKEQELISKDKAFKELVEKLQRNGAIMSVSERTKLEKEAGLKQKELQRLQAKLQEEAGTRQREETQKYVEKLKLAIKQVALKEKMDMVLFSDVVVYSNQPDITQKVMQAFAK